MNVKSYIGIRYTVTMEALQGSKFRWTSFHHIIDMTRINPPQNCFVFVTFSYISTLFTNILAELLRDNSHDFFQKSNIIHEIILTKMYLQLSNYHICNNWKGRRNGRIKNKIPNLKLKVRVQMSNVVDCVFVGAINRANWCWINQRKCDGMFSNGSTNGRDFFLCACLRF